MVKLFKGRVTKAGGKKAKEINLVVQDVLDEDEKNKEDVK